MGDGGGSDGNGVRGRVRSRARSRPSIATSCRWRRETVWSLIKGWSSYRSWWPWLRQFEGRGLSVGDEWRCTVQPPVPYLVRFRVVIDHVEAPTLVRARVLGDVVGDATLTLETSERRRRCASDGNGADRVPGGCVALVAQLAGPGQHGAGGRVALCRAGRPLRARLGPRLRGTAVHRQGGRARPRRASSHSLPRREVLLSADPGLRRGGGARGAHRIELRRQGHDHRRRHRLGRRDPRARRSVSQSIERGHEAVKQVVVRVPDGSTSTLLRRLGGTGTAGGARPRSTAADEPEPTEVVGAGRATRRRRWSRSGRSADDTEHARDLGGGSPSDAATERLEASTVPMPTAVCRVPASWE